MTKKQNIRQTSIKLEDENYQIPTANYLNKRYSPNFNYIIA